MEFEIPNQLDLNKRGQTTLIRAQKALEMHEPDKAARFLRRATIKSTKDEMARDLMLAVTLSHCNLPTKALATVMSSIVQYTMTREQRLFHRIVEGELLSVLGKGKQALRVLDGCASEAAALNRKDLAAEALIREGGVQSTLGNQALALERLSSAVVLANGVDDKRLMTRALAEKAAVRYRLGDFGEALGIAREAMAASDGEDSFGRALGYRQIGIVHGTLYRFFDSLEAHRNALGIFNELAYIPGQIGEYLSLCETYLNMGDIALAAHFAESAQGLAEDGDNPILLASVYGELGRLSLAVGEFPRALERYRNLKGIAQKQESDVFRGAADCRLGIAEMFSGDYRKAFGLLEEAARRFLETGDRPGAMQAVMRLSQVAPLLGAEEQARALALRTTVTEGDSGAYRDRPGDLADRYFIDAYEMLATGRLAEAIVCHDEGIDVLTHHKCFLEAALARYLFGKISLDKQSNAACDILEQALKLTDTYGFQDLTKRILGTIGTIEGRGEEIVVEYSLDKAAVRQLGEDDALQDDETRFNATEIIGDSPRILEVLAELKRFAPTDLPILVLGQSGTGKELVARRAHEMSARAMKPFVAINCATLPSGIIDVELFGGKKGAYSGLTNDRRGLVLEANQGTLFLDELGEFPLELQPKLLRFLQEGEVRPLGSDKIYKVDVRIVAATNMELEEAVRRGAFREDLFYRLNVITLTLPPLADRERDIVTIARHFLDINPYARQKGIEGISRAAVTTLLNYDWPGNIRELCNVIQAAAVRARGKKITTEDLKLRSASGSGPSTLLDSEPTATSPSCLDVRTRDEVMMENIRQALSATGGNQSEAAKQLGIHRNTLRNWLKRMQDSAKNKS